MELKKAEQRIKDLESYSILDTLPEKEFDNLTTIASEICQTPMSLITLLDQERQWFKSAKGLDATETPLEQSFCIHTADHNNGPFIIKDARSDDRFKHNPLVTGAPNVVFYAGIPLISDNGNALGSLCVVDTKPKELSPSQIESLSALASQVMCLMEARKSKLIAEENENKIKLFHKEATKKVLESTNNIKNLTRILERTDIELDERTLTIMDLLKESSDDLKVMIQELSEQS